MQIFEYYFPSPARPALRLKPNNDVALDTQHYGEIMGMGRKYPVGQIGRFVMHGANVDDPCSPLKMLINAIQAVYRVRLVNQHLKS